jgi:hypothetical protein
VLWSRELGIGFAWQEDGRLVRVVTADGGIVPTAQEEAALRREAEARAEALAAELQRLQRATGEEAGPSSY